MNGIYTIILCGGSGTRMGLSQNKTLLALDGVPAFIRCIRAFKEDCDGIVLIIRAQDRPLFVDALAAFGEDVTAMVNGGEDRQASVYQGLKALPEECGIVLVHDGARPLVTKETVKRVIDGVKKHGNAVAAVPARDTIKIVRSDDTVHSTLNRDTLRIIQTPQGFYRDILQLAHENALARATDDAALLEAQGVQVHLVMGDYSNIKLTSAEDYAMAQALFTSYPRTGNGYDVHKLAQNRALVLCGVTIPWEHGLAGHSDADVATHALIDALLGAAAMGDIGQHFPDSHPAYKGISSIALLQAVASKIKGAGYRILHVDITMIAQAPKLAPFIPQMRDILSKTLELPLNCVSVKATTTEGLGFEGRGEGISAQATATIL